MLLQFYERKIHPNRNKQACMKDKYIAVVEVNKNLRCVKIYLGTKKIKSMI